MNRNQAVAYVQDWLELRWWGGFNPPKGWIWRYEGRTLTLASIDGYSPIFLGDAK